MKTCFFTTFLGSFESFPSDEIWKWCSKVTAPSLEKMDPRRATQQYGAGCEAPFGRFSPMNREMLMQGVTFRAGMKVIDAESGRMGLKTQSALLMRA
jgi:hypothetical protein